MNKKYERFLWIAAVIFAVFTIHNQANTNVALEMLLKTYNVESNIQKSEITDFNNQMHLVRDNSYRRGFEDGRTQAGIALAQGRSLYEYQDGYHAALTQFTEPIESNKSPDSMFAEMLIDFMDHELSTEEAYWELLEYMTEDPSLKANAEQPNK